MKYTVKNVGGKLVALSVLPALALSVFSLPVSASEFPHQSNKGDTTTIKTSTTNSASITNVVSSSANTGGNVAFGGNGGNGGSSANIATIGGNGGNAKADADTGKGGDADAEKGSAIGGESGDAAAGAVGGNGGNTKADSVGGNGGNGGEVAILTGNAVAATTIINDNINTTQTDISVEDCGCDKYDETYVSADHLKSQESSFSLDKESNDNSGHGYKKHDGNDESLNVDKDKSSYEEDHFEKYTKTAVPINVDISDEVTNEAIITNAVVTDVNTGNNVAGGANGGNGGDSANIATVAGAGGNAKADADSGDAGDANAASKSYDNSKYGGYDFGKHSKYAKKGSTYSHGDEDSVAMGGNSGNTDAAAYGGEGGDADAASKGGNGGDGGTVTVWTGDATALNEISNGKINVVKRSITRTAN